MQTRMTTDTAKIITLRIELPREAVELLQTADHDSIVQVQLLSESNNRPMTPLRLSPGTVHRLTRDS